MIIKIPWLYNHFLWLSMTYVISHDFHGLQNRLTKFHTTFHDRVTRCSMHSGKCHSTKLNWKPLPSQFRRCVLFSTKTLASISGEFSVSCTTLLTTLIIAKSYLNRSLTLLLWQRSCKKIKRLPQANIYLFWHQFWVIFLMTVTWVLFTYC